MSKSEWGWAEYLADPRGPHEYLEQLKRVRLHEAAIPDAALHAFTLAPDWLASAAVLRPRAECVTFVEALRPAFDACINYLSLFPAGGSSLRTLDVLSFAAIAETLGEKLDLLDVDVDALLKKCLAPDALTPPAEVAAVLMQLARGKHGGVKLLGKGIHTDPVALVKLLDLALASNKPHLVADAWERFVDSFPSLLAGQMAEWRQLLLAARLVYSNLGKLPVEKVAEKLAERVRQR